MTAKKKKHGLRKQWPFYVMMAPGLLYLLVNNYGPISGLFIAFKQIDYTKGIFGSPWVGFKNSRQMRLSRSREIPFFTI